ncbi:hypothetical protein [Mesorhizobium sp. WSM1293]|uniref:hypothetical protein n=1 Tax=Mesorhizobium sp. WSM1293 TaxID=1040984 RepID=UPI00067E6F7D
MSAFRECHWAAVEIEREATLTADDALPETSEIASSDILEVEALAAGLSGDEAQALVDGRAVTEWAMEQAARDLKARRTRESEVIRKPRGGKSSGIWGTFAIREKKHSARCSRPRPMG